MSQLHKQKFFLQNSQVVLFPDLISALLCSFMPLTSCSSTLGEFCQEEKHLTELKWPRDHLSSSPFFIYWKPSAPSAFPPHFKHSLYVPKPLGRSNFSKWAFCSAVILILVMAESSVFLIKRQTRLTRDDFEEHLHLWGDAGSLATHFPPMIEFSCVTICLERRGEGWDVDRGGRLSDIPINLSDFSSSRSFMKWKARLWGLSWCRRAVLFLRRRHQTDKLCHALRQRAEPSFRFYAPEIPELWSNLCFQSFWALKFGSFTSNIARICCSVTPERSKYSNIWLPLVVANRKWKSEIC